MGLFLHFLGRPSPGSECRHCRSRPPPTIGNVEDMLDRHLLLALRTIVLEGRDQRTNAPKALLDILDRRGASLGLCRPQHWRQRSSPRRFRAKRASDAALFLVLGAADREFIIEIGEDRDGCVDPSRQAAAKLQPGDLSRERHEVRPRIDGVGLGPQSRQRLALRYGCHT